MDTEFPGVVARPVGDVTAADYQYKTLKCNVDLLKVGEGGREREGKMGIGMSLFDFYKTTDILGPPSVPSSFHPSNYSQIIQLGLSFADAEGNSPQDCPTWQLNFKFSLNDDIYAEDSIELLKQSGIDFSKHEVRRVEGREERTEGQ